MAEGILTPLTGGSKALLTRCRVKRPVQLRKGSVEPDRCAISGRKAAQHGRVEAVFLRQHPRGQRFGRVACEDRHPRLAEGFDALLHLAGAVLLGILTSAFWPQFLRSFGRNEMVGTVGQFLAPIWPVHGIVVLGAALMTLVFALRALLLAIRAVRGMPA